MHIYIHTYIHTYTHTHTHTYTHTLTVNIRTYTHLTEVSSSQITNTSANSEPTLEIQNLTFTVRASGYDPRAPKPILFGEDFEGKKCKMNLEIPRC